MPNFIVNSNKYQGHHEVHDISRTCGSPHFPALYNQVPLGWFSSCHGAVQEANSRGFSPADGCYWCATACHTR